MRKVILLILFAFILSGSCCAELIDEDSIQNAIPDSAREITDGMSISDAGDLKDLAPKLGAAVKKAISSDKNMALKNAVSILLIAIICSAANVFGDGSAAEYIPLCGCAAVTVICAGDISSYISTCTAAIRDISVFANAILPALCIAGAAGGAVTAASVKYAASALFMDLLITAVRTVILPLIYFYIAITVSAAAFQSKSLSGVSKLIKQVCTILMTAITIVFTAYLSISSAVASGGDAVALRVTKTAISTALPVVGSILSDAASSVLAGADLIKAGAGVFGMAATLAICVLPFAVLGLNYLVFKAAGVCVNALQEPKLAAAVDGIGTAYGLMLGCVGSCGLILFISILSCVRTVTG